MTVTFMWSGALTDTTARVKAKVAGTSARLKVADNAAMSGGVFFGPVTPGDVAQFTATGLTAKTQYWYQVEDNGVLDTSKTGRFRTVAPAGEPWDFTFAAAACAGLTPDYPGNAGALVPGRISNHPVFDEIRLADPDLFIHMGDFHYYNWGSGSFGLTATPTASDFRTSIDDVLTYCPRQALCYQNVPIDWSYDDHDYGRNDDDRSNPNRDASATAWAGNSPHYTVASPNVAGDMGIYRSWLFGRVKFIATDLRYYRDPPTDPAPRKMLGTTQLAWFDSELGNAEAQGAELICWISTQPSNSNGTTSWGSYPEERATIYQMIGDHGWLSPRKRFFEIAGDQHQLGFDSGVNTAGFPLYTLASLDSANSGGASGYDRGSRPGRGQYGLITIRDFGQTIRVTVKGMVTVV